MSSSTPILSSWQDTIQNSIGQVLPGVTVIVLSGTVIGSQEVDTDMQPGSPLASIFSDPYGDNPVDQENLPLTTEAGNGTFQFWAQPGYYVIQVYGPGINGQLVYGISIGGSGGSGGAIASAVPTGAINGTNVSFTVPAAGGFLVQNRVVLVPGVDYTISGLAITMANPPAPGDSLVWFYID